MRFRSLIALFVCMALGGPMSAKDPPSAAALRSAFEAQYPKTEATADAMELERLAAGLGIDLVPNASLETLPGPDDEVRYPKVARERPGPTREAQKASQPIRASAGQYVSDQLKNPEERVAAPPPALDAYLAEQQDVFGAIEAVLLGDVDVRWEMDVKKLGGGPVPSLRGLIQLQRLLVARVLRLAHHGEADRALQTLEAAWALNETLSSRPEIICQLIVVAVAKLHVGALRKLDTPAWGWPDRLRSDALLSAFVAAYQNQVWTTPLPSDESDLREFDAYARMHRQVAEEFREGDLCSWTSAKLQESWERGMRDLVADEEESRVIASIHAPNISNMFGRWRRYMIDAELTALVLDARAERAASRRRAWPDRLRTLGTGVCPAEPWSYRTSGMTATFAFEGKIQEATDPAFLLPLRFTAGLPAAPARRSPTPGPRKATTPRSERPSPSP